MMIYLERQRKKSVVRVLSTMMTGVLITSLILPPPRIYAQVFPVEVMPAPGVMINPTAAFHPPMMRGLSIYPNNPLMFDFIIEDGDTPLQGEALKEESRRLIKYFLAALTVPDEEMWVNLSPYEKDQMIAPNFGLTEMGRDLLAQDYLLKQLTASLMYPEKELGKEFWKRVYDKVYQLYGTTDIPLNTFNKVWIVPDKAVVYEQGGMAFVGESHLKVMLEQDYLSLQRNLGSEKLGTAQIDEENVKALSGVASEIVHEVLIPEIEKEVNEGKTFANLRQIYNSVILASWYKDHLKESLLGQVYVGKNKIKGVDADDPHVKEKIYQQYVEAFKKGVYDYLKEDYDPATRQTVVRQYFSGGIVQSVKGAKSGAQGTDLHGINDIRQDIPRTPDWQPPVNGNANIVTTGLGDVGTKGDVKAAQEDVERVESKLAQVQSSPSVSLLEDLQPGIYQIAEGKFYGMMGVASNPLNDEKYAFYTELKDDSGHYPRDAVFFIKPLEQFRTEVTAEPVQSNIEGEVEALLVKRAQFDRSDGYRLITRVEEAGVEYVVYQHQATGALLLSPLNKFFSWEANNKPNEKFSAGSLKSIGLAEDLKPIPAILRKKWEEESKDIPEDWSNEDVAHKIIYAPELKGLGRLAYHFRDAEDILVIVFDLSLKEPLGFMTYGSTLKTRIWRHEIEEDRWQQWLMTRFVKSLVYQDGESERILERTAHILTNVQEIDRLYQPLQFQQELSPYDIVFGKKDRTRAMLPEHVYDLNTKSKEELLRLLKEDRSTHNNNKLFNLLGRVHTAWNSDVRDKSVVQVPPGSYRTAEEFYLNYVSYGLVFKEYVLQLLRTKWGLVTLSKEDIKEIEEAYAAAAPNEKQRAQWAKRDEFSSRVFDPVRQKEFFTALEQLSSSRTTFEDRLIPTGIYKDRKSQYRGVVGQVTDPQTNEKYVLYMVLDQDHGRYSYPGNGLWQIQPVQAFSAEVRSEDGNLLYVKTNESGEDQLDELYRDDDRLLYADQEDQYYVALTGAHYAGKNYVIYRKLDGDWTLLTMPQNVFGGKVNKKVRFRLVGTKDLKEGGINLLSGLYKDLIDNDPMGRDKHYDVIGTAFDTESSQRYALYIHPTNDIAPKKTLGSFLWITPVDEFLWTADGAAGSGQARREPRVTFLRESRGENKPLVEVEELIEEEGGLVAAGIAHGFYRDSEGTHVYEVLGVARDSKDANKEYVAYRAYQSSYMVEGSAGLQVTPKDKFREILSKSEFMGADKEVLFGGSLKNIGRPEDLPPVPSAWIEEWKQQARSSNAVAAVSEKGVYFHRVYDARLGTIGRMAYHFQDPSVGLIVAVDPGILKLEMADIDDIGHFVELDMIEHEIRESQWQPLIQMMVDTKKVPSLTKEEIERVAHAIVTMQEINIQYVFLTSKEPPSTRGHIFLEGKMDSLVLPPHQYDLQKRSNEDLIKLLKEDRSSNHQWVVQQILPYLTAAKEIKAYGPLADFKPLFFKSNETKMYLDYVTYTLGIKEYIWHLLEMREALDVLSADELREIGAAYLSSGLKREELEKFGVKPGSTFDKALGSERQLNFFTKLNDYARVKQSAPAISTPEEKVEDTGAMLWRITPEVTAKMNQEMSLSEEDIKEIAGILGITPEDVAKVDPKDIESHRQMLFRFFQDNYDRRAGLRFGTDVELKTKLQQIAQKMINADRGHEMGSLELGDQEFLSSILDQSTLYRISDSALRAGYYASLDLPAAVYFQAYGTMRGEKENLGLESWLQAVRQVRANRSAEIEQPPSVQAKPTDPGGIDLNPALFDLQIKRDGNGVPLPIQQQPLQTINIQGFLPIIINVVPVSLPALLGAAGEKNETDKDLSLQFHPQTPGTIREPFGAGEFEEVPAG